ncbi:dihydrofolate reductase family protein [Bounagaea algeriensis]
MARLIYSVICSLDGYVADRAGNFDWAVPSEEVLDFVNAQERAVGTYLYGRRMYELMAVWETDPAAAAQSPKSAEFAEVWQAADKVVYSTTLPRVFTSRTKLEREFDPESVRQLKAACSSDLNIAGPELAGHAFRSNLIDELQLMAVPVLVGAGKSCLPAELGAELELVDERRFGNGMVQLRYDVLGPL